MAQWDIYAVEGGGLALDIQSDLISGSRLRIVVPLLPRDEVDAVDPRLAPDVVVGDLNLIAYVLGITSLPGSMLKRRVASAEGAHDDILRALDMVLSGV